MSQSPKGQNPPASDDGDPIDKYLLDEESVRSTQEISMAMQQVPLTLQPFFKENANLNRELVQRFPNMPLMSTIRIRDLYSDGERSVATLSTQDGSASLIVDVSRNVSDIQFAFTYGSMISLRFQLTELSNLDRRTWLDNVSAPHLEDIVFLWGQSRWVKDYIICVPHSYYISLLAFSPNNFEAAVRITPSISKDLFAWLAELWYPKEEEPDDSDELGGSSDIFGSW